MTVMTARFALLVDAGAAETRFAAVRGDGAVVGLAFARSIADPEAPDAPLRAGDVAVGVVRAIEPAVGGAFVDVGAARDAFAPFRKTPSGWAEGARVLAAVRREADGVKGAVLDPDWRASGLSASAVAPDAARRPPGRASPALSPALEAFRRWPPRRFAEILYTDVRLADPLRDVAATTALSFDALSFDAQAFADVDFEARVDDALVRAAPIGDGGRLTFDETAAGAFVDVDAGAALERGRAKGAANDRLNAKAASVAIAELARRSIGGRIVVDFTTPSGAPARKALESLLRAELARAGPALAGARLGRVAPDGLADIVAPRRGPSLLAFATEEVADDKAPFARPGLAFRVPWRARRAIAAAEARLAASPRARFKLDLGARLAAMVAERNEWTDRLAAAYGPRLAVAPAADLTPWEHRLVERP